ncbi:hypothetical protein [Mycobacterium sp. ACS4331]|uniref:hypothetical protein n=1 Tax=Mycobacterium sp. ACS4331 TaxID=1834121 RepID=UPI0008364C71|nr:hypothetical protein [Mycobacterium sp. ACS4331]
MGFYQQVSGLLDSLSLSHRIEKVERGSVFGSIKTWFKRPANKEKIAEKLNEALAVIEQYGKSHVSTSIAHVDNTIAQTLLTISQSAGDNDYAVCLHGVISYRVTLPNGSKRQVSRRITAREAAILDSRPGLLDNPQGLLGALNEIIDLEDNMAARELIERPDREPDTGTDAGS